MSDLIRCDQCQAEAVAPVGWLLVERFGIDVSRAGDSVGPWHFCAVAHLAEWAGSRP
jgi:hypothetical protein